MTDKIVEIEHPKITKDDIVARVVTFEDGTAAIQTFSRPHKKWIEGGLDWYAHAFANGVTEEYLKEAGYTDEEIKLVYEGEENWT